MDRKSRKENRLPHGLGFMMWPALVRAPWLIGSLMDGDERREKERRRKLDY